MREQEFIAYHESTWQWLSAFLAGKQPDNAGEFPARYRALCVQLAQARGQGFSEALIMRLNALAVQSAARLYRPRNHAMAVADFIIRDLPRAVRREWRWIAFAAGLFLLSVLLAAVAQAMYPVLASHLGLSYSLSEMYEPSSHLYRSAERAGQDDVMMWGYYIGHNTSISLKAAAGGALAGLSTLYVDIFNGIILGVALMYGAQEGWLVQTFLPFIVAHSSFELTSLVFAAAIGFALAKAVCFPGVYRRRDAVALVARRFFPLLVAVIAFDFMAAAIEAFWSPRQLPLSVKLTVGLLMWLALLAYFRYAGREEKYASP